MFNLKKIVAHALVAVAGAAVLVGITPTMASAATRNGVCEGGEICFYWGYGVEGSISDFTTSIANYGSTQPGCYEFKTEDDGQYECMKNNAASALNLSSRTVRVYVNSYFGGSYEDIRPYTSANLTVTANNNASHKFL
ncbi:peptidase inhibitor family I36 protein [Micromonosporaceae bacterium B7E4]